jgi:hypothetical protein
MQRIINVGLLISSLFCYLQWADQSAFLFQAEYEVFFGANSSVQSFSHPLILLPIAGQLLLLFGVIKEQRNFRLTFIGMGMIGVLVLMVCFVGVISGSAKIFLSTLPFILISVFTIVRHKKLK